MDRRERYENPEASLLAAMRGQQAEVWTALPGIIQSFDHIHLTCSVQPAIQAQFTSPVDGKKSWLTLPLLVDCPVIYPQGGNCTLTFPIAKNDECLVIFSSRCIDAWWQNGGIQSQPQLRMHDLSDGFVMVGVRSQIRVLTNVSQNAVQLRSDDGTTRVELNPTNQTVNLVAPGGINITGPLSITGTVVNNGVNISSTHVHTDPQGGNTGVPH